VKNCNCTLPKHLHTKPGGFVSKLIRTTRAGIFLLLLAFPTLSHVYALQTAATAEFGSFANELILKTIVIDNYAPYTFVNNEGQPDGFSVDLMRAVAQVMGVKLEIKVDTWDNARHALENGQIDFLPMMAYSAERDKLYDFSPPHTIAYDAFFTRKDASPISSMNDLQGKKIIVMESDQAHDYLKSLASIKAEQLILVASLPEALRLLASGSGDTALMPKLVGLALIRDLNLTDLGPSPVVVEAYNRPFSFAVKEGNQAILERLNQGMSIVKATGQYDEIYKKWFGTLEPIGVTNEIFLKYLGGIILVFLLIGAVLLLWSYSLRKQVAERTRSLEMEIQERKWAEGALKENASLLRTVAENYPNSYVSIIEKDLTIGFTSGQEFKKQDLDPAQFVGLTLEQVFGEHAPLVRDHYLKTFDGAETQFVLLINHQYQYYRTVPLMDQNGKINRIMAVVENITERKQAEEALRKSEARFRQMFEKHDAIMLLIEPQTGLIMDVNQSAAKFYGYEKSKLITMNINDINTLAPEQVTEERRKALEEERNYFVFTHRLANGKERIVEVHSSPVFVNEKQMLFSVIHDISERKRSEQALRESEEKYRLSELELKEAQSTAHIGNWKWDVKKGEITWSDEMFRIFGIEKDSYSGRLGDVIKGVIHPDDLHLVLPSNAAAIANEPIEYRIIMPDSSIRHIWAKSGTTISDQDGKPAFLTGIAQDITERKKAEVALLESEERFRRLAENAQDLIYRYELSPQRGFSYVSRAATVMTGYTPEEHFADPDLGFKLVHPDDRHLLESTTQAGRDIRSPLILRWIRKDGTLLWTEQRNVPIYDESGNLIALEGIAIDITERIRVETALRESEKKYRLIAENTSDGIIIFGADSRIQYASPGYLKQLGYSEIEELARTPDVIYSSLHPDDREVAFAKIYEAIELKQAGAIYSYRVKHAAGHYIWREDNAKFQYDSSGKYAGSYVICRDITERKQAEDQLKEQLEELRRWQNITQGREDRILQLKSEINRLLVEAGKPPRFASLNGVNLEPPGRFE